jgi:amino acid permease
MFCCILSGISAVYLGKSWNIIEERWPEYRITQADPYAIIGLKAFGKKVQVVVSLLVSVQLYGVAIVFLSICTELFVGVLKSLELSFTFSTCEWVIIIGLLIIPLTWLSSPAEISWIAYGAMCCTAISFVLLIALYCKALVDEEHKSEAPSTVNFKSYFLSLGTIAFVYGGAATFPTFQNHMKDKKQFSHSVFSAFSGQFKHV